MKKSTIAKLAALSTLAIAAMAVPAAAEAEVRNVVYIVNGNLGDKSFFDSAEAGLKQLEADGRITLNTIELGGTAQDQPKWLETLYEVSDSMEYDLVVCGTYQMPDYLKEVAEAYPDQKYLIFDDDTHAGEDSNVVNIVFKQNDLGYLVGTFAGGAMAVIVARLFPVKLVLNGVDVPIERSSTFLMSALYPPYRFFVMTTSSSACPMIRQTCCSVSFMKQAAGCFVQHPKHP